MITADDVFERLKILVSKVLQTAREKNVSQQMDISRDTNLFDDLGIDSLEIMDLLAAAEKEFGITIDVQEASQKQTMSELTNHIVTIVTKHS